MSRLDRLPYHARTHLPGGSDPIPGLAGDTAPVPFNDYVTELAATLDLRGYWRLGDGAAPFADTSGHALGAADMALVTAASGTPMSEDYTPGALETTSDDGAVKFNVANSGSADYLDAPDPGTRRFNLDSTDMTITAFARPTASASTWLGGVITNYHQGGWGSGGGWGFFVSWPTREIQFRRGGNSGAYEAVLVGPALPADEWVFLAATYDGTNGHRLYVNAELVAADATTHNNMPTFNNGPSIARAGATSFTNRFYGAIDEVTVWGDALTADQIATLASGAELPTSDDFLSVVKVTTAYVATSTDDNVFASGTFNVTLPSAVGLTGHRLTIKNTGSGTITVVRPTGENIDGAASNITMSTTKQAREFTSDGTGWQITAAYL
jgi:hypothetical protein